MNVNWSDVKLHIIKDFDTVESLIDLNFAEIHRYLNIYLDTDSTFQPRITNIINYLVNHYFHVKVEFKEFETSCMVYRLTDDATPSYWRYDKLFVVNVDNGAALEFGLEPEIFVKLYGAYLALKDN